MTEVIFLIEDSPEGGFDDYSLRVESLAQTPPKPGQQLFELG